ncbi:MAG TPA: trypsin-like peptidase domain-containing protein [Candidatus Limnocylindria bacterium]|nr:trypsin-like peptidase domain-containing protein [Candidatus Limnocylindria bacterium]
MKLFEKKWILVLASLLASIAGVRAAAAAPAPDIRRDATVEAVQRALPAVVNIRTETIVERHDPFEQLFTGLWGPYYRRRGPETTYSLGSGVIIDEDGWVLTNFHVVSRATKVFVRLTDGRELEAERVVGASFTDVALLKISNPKGEKFSAIQFASDDDLLLGETVIALGNPFGLGGSVSKGILSSKSRRPPLENEPLEVEDWLQTDAAINPGNSGGPLVNLRGDLIGVSVAVYREGQGIGFAIPVRRVTAALSDMYSPETLRSLWFGARVKPGILPLTISSVQPESPAGKAGLRAGDQIVEVNGKAPKRFIEFIRELIDAGTSNTVSLVVQRDGQRHSARVRLVRESSFFNSDLVRKKIGLSIEDVTPEIARTLGLGDKRGVVITDVDADSPAARAGLQKNMIITTVDGQVAWYEMQPAPSFVPVAKALYAKARGDKSQFEVIIPRRVGRFVELQQAKVEVAVR